jgi:excisionase family DNA binding protein
MAVRSGDGLLTVDEARRALGVSAATMWRLLRRGEIASLLRGGRRLIPRRGLTARQRRSTALPVLDDTHPIFRLIGAGRSGGKAPGARDKHAVVDDR